MAIDFSRRSYLRLISSREAPSHAAGPSQPPRYVQAPLFAGRPDRTLVFLELDGAGSEDLVSVLRDLKPRLVIDLRDVPRFDIGHLNRKAVFGLFTETDTKYFDLSPATGIPGAPLQDVKRLADVVKATLAQENEEPMGPLVFLIDSAEGQTDLVYDIARTIESPRMLGWDVVLAPAETELSTQEVVGEPSGQDVLFISHATPDDNDFVLWLSAQLKRLGYEVWADIANLRGGEPIWESVEQVIRERAAKVIVVLSKKAQSKAGVLDELNLAITLERAERRANFVIPLRLDDVPYHAIQLNLLRKNILDFAQSWASGFKALAQTLASSGVRRKRSFGADPSSWVYRASPASRVDPNKSETLVSNWFSLISTPPALHCYVSSTGQQQWPAISHVPHVSFRGTSLCFSHPSQRGALDVQHRGTVAFSELLAGNGSNFLQIAGKDGARIAANMLRQAFVYRLSEKRLLPYGPTLRQSWYVPSGLIPRDEVTFVDQSGAVRRKKLVGRSERRQIFWHYAVQPRVFVQGQPRVTVRATVVFSEDGRTPIESVERQHQLRRSFCRNWWNDRWRDLLNAFMDWMSDGKETNIVYATDEGCVAFARRSLSFVAPIALNDEGSISADETEDFILEDEDVDEFVTVLMHRDE